MRKYTLSRAFVPTQTIDIPAFGGKLDVTWSPESQVTQWGGLAYFVSYLKTSGLFDRLVVDAPFRYTSPNAPRVRDVIGTTVLAIVCGFTRYSHINRLRNDTVLAKLLGLGRIVCEEAPESVPRFSRSLSPLFLRKHRGSTGVCPSLFPEPVPRFSPFRSPLRCHESDGARPRVIGLDGERRGGSASDNRKGPRFAGKKPLEGCS